MKVLVTGGCGYLGRASRRPNMNRTIDPDLERFMAKRMNAMTIELDASHLSIVSKAREVADLIMKAASTS
jgi:nucleoside-diphosphate-sugar epimerase